MFMFSRPKNVSSSCTLSQGSSKSRIFFYSQQPADLMISWFKNAQSLAQSLEEQNSSGRNSLPWCDSTFLPTSFLLNKPQNTWTLNPLCSPNMLYLSYLLRVLDSFPYVRGLSGMMYHRELNRHLNYGHFITKCCLASQLLASDSIFC